METGRDDISLKGNKNGELLFTLPSDGGVDSTVAGGGTA